MSSAAGVFEFNAALDMYAGTSNFERAEAITSTAPVLPPGTRPGLAVAILNLDRADLLLPLLDVLADGPAVFAAAGMDFQVLIGDTGSTDAAVLDRYARAAEEPWLQVRTGMAYQFSRCNNELLAQAADVDRYLLLNNDVVLPSVEPLVAMAQHFDTHDRVGVVGLRLDFPDGNVQHAGIDFFTEGEHAGLPYHPGGGSRSEHRPGRTMDLMATTGAALMTRADLWWRIGGLDEAYEAECQDVDYCLAARRLGATVKVLDAGPVVHLESATRAPGEHSEADRRLLLRRWRSFLGGEFR